MQRIQTIIQLIEANYIAEDKIPAITSHLRECSDHYATLDDDALCQALTADLRQTAGDGHFYVFKDPAYAAKLHAGVEDNEPDTESLTRWRMTNNGFTQVRILEGNVGYIELREFVELTNAWDTAVAAMTLVAQAEALIFDLRRNGGGAPSMVQFLLTYLFAGEPQLYNQFYHRPTGETRQLWTLPHVPGKRLPDVPVYVLTGRTGSAAESFAYSLKHMGRATLIGTATDGVAHPIDALPIDDQLVIFLPAGRPINPITGTNWEGIGVLPHIETEAEDALEVALMTIW